LSVWENIVYRREPRRGSSSTPPGRGSVQELARRHGLPIDPMARVPTARGVRQRLEI